MKKVIILLITLVLSSCFFACNPTNSNNKNVITYSTNYGSKIENISKAKQTKINEYVVDCKTLFISAYKESVVEYITNPFIDFTDTFVYDFSTVNEASLNEPSTENWERIKKLHNSETTPIMYIELYGYCSYYGDNYIPHALSDIGVMNGFFIFEDNSVVSYTFRRICNYTYYYELINGTTVINCGDKYAEKTTSSYIKSFNKQPTKLHNVA